jgi:hypothetical protein
LIDYDTFALRFGFGDGDGFGYFFVHVGLEFANVTTVLAGHLLQLVLVLHAFSHELGLLLSSLNGTNTRIPRQTFLFLCSVLSRQAFAALVILKSLGAGPLQFLLHLLAE